MDNLNTVLLEGIVKSDPEKYYGHRHMTEATFEVMMQKFHKDGERRWEREEIIVLVKVCGKVAENCIEMLGMGFFIRVVGHLTNHHNKVAVVAEHVEFHPAHHDPMETEEEII